MKKIFSILFGLVFISVPSIALAGATAIANPLGVNSSTIPLFIENFLKVMVQVGLPIVALFLLIAGYKFASAGGNSGKLDEAKENFKYVILGALLILGAWVIATLIGNTVSQVVTGS